MDQVKVNKGALRAIIESNRIKHRAEFQRAWDGYRKACIEALEANLAAFKAGKAQHIVFNEMPPEDHTKDYERVELMLGMSTEEEITLSAEHFAQYVQDEWHWKRLWAMSNSKYLG